MNHQQINMDLHKIIMDHHKIIMDLHRTTMDLHKIIMDLQETIMDPPVINTICIMALHPTPTGHRVTGSRDK